MEIVDALFDFIFYGVLERYPGLKIVRVENEIGWLPFMLQQWDYYYNRFKKVNPLPITKNPSEYFKTQISARSSATQPPVMLRAVGSGQLHVVERLSARQLDLAGFEEIYRPRSRPLAARIFVRSWSTRTSRTSTRSTFRTRFNRGDSLVL